MACISYWVISESELVAFWSGMSSVSGSREITTPGGVGGRVAGDALELLRDVDQPLDARVRVVQLAQLRRASRAPRPA